VSHLFRSQLVFLEMGGDPRPSRASIIDFISSNAFRHYADPAFRPSATIGAYQGTRLFLSGIRSDPEELQRLMIRSRPAGKEVRGEIEG